MERIDVHAHAVPAVWRKHCMENGWEKPDGMAGIPEWTVEAQLDLMKRANIARSVLSITSPGTYLAPGNAALCRKITRETNMALAKIVDAHNDRLDFWASLPLPDVDGSLEEIDFALDILKAKGFLLLTNSNGVYLGDRLLDPVFKKLDQRKAIVMLHPTTCQLCPSGHSGQATEARAETSVPLSQYPRPMMEFFFDTARAVTNLILSKTVEKNPNITFIIPHCGAVLPSIIERFTTYSTKVYGKDAISSEDVRRMFKTRFYFDLAGFPFPDQIHGLLRFTDATRLVYGTDYPFLPEEAVLETGKINDRYIKNLFDEEEQRQVYFANAQAILDRE